MSRPTNEGKFNGNLQELGGDEVDSDRIITNSVGGAAPIISSIQPALSAGLSYEGGGAVVPPRRVFFSSPGGAVNPFIPENLEQQRELESLKREVSHLRSSLAVLQKEPVTDKRLGELIGAIIEQGNRIQQNSDRLTAPVETPPEDELTIRLVRADRLDELERYRMETSLAFGVSGVFAAALLAIVVGWGSSDPVNITRPSLLLAVLFLFLTGLAGLVTWNRHDNANAIKARMLRSPIKVAEAPQSKN